MILHKCNAWLDVVYDFKDNLRQKGKTSNNMIHCDSC